jgi:hypothetical protein
MVTCLSLRIGGPIFAAASTDLRLFRIVDLGQILRLARSKR